MRILLVDDDALSAELVVAVRTREGHVITVEHRGVTGRDRALAERFDLILLDMRLPGMHGDEICRELRVAGVTVPIIAVSADALASQVERSLSGGFDSYVLKPYVPETLRAAVRAFDTPAG